ncbi:phosphatase PAP2 family protein [Streptomyces sp. NPDC060194]|uniref:phosphatase PAP2 family protein n=1 Tax=Streptomyces sp. NPDC060194 TaxID=3347069 RepID=UPI003650A7DD
MRRPGPVGRPGTTPPVPGRPAPFPLRATAAVCAVLFTLITWQVAAHGPLWRLDVRAGEAVAGRGPAGLAEFFADLGNPEVAGPVLAVAMAYGLRRGLRAPVYTAGLALLAVPLLVVPLKLLLARPGTPVVPPGTGYYPSGHTATAAVAYGSAALLLVACARAPGRLVPAALLALAGALTGATGTGLVLRGYHWPLDVLASLCLSGVLLAAVAGTVLRSRAAGGRQPK